MFEPPSDVLLKTGELITSPGGSYNYQIIGPCCRLYDRETLPWPSCSIGWRGKQPSWRRIGARFVADMGCKRCPSYAVQHGETILVISLYWIPLPKAIQRWWFTPMTADLKRFGNESNAIEKSCGKLVASM